MSSAAPCCIAAVVRRKCARWRAPWRRLGLSRCSAAPSPSARTGLTSKVAASRPSNGRSRPGRAPGRALRVYAPGGQSGGEFIASSPDSSFWHDPELCEAPLSGRLRTLERIRRRAFSGEVDPVRRRNGQNKKRAVSTHVETARSHRGRHSEPHLTIRPTGIYWRGFASKAAMILSSSWCVGRRSRSPLSPTKPSRLRAILAKLTCSVETVTPWTAAA